MSINEYFTDLASKHVASVTAGPRYAYHAWRATQEHGADMFEVDELLPWGEGAPATMVEFIDTLRAAGVETFAVTDRSTALMDELLALFATGCTLVGPCTVTRRHEYWGIEERTGLEFKIN